MRDPANDVAIYLESQGLGSRTAGAHDWLIRTGALDDAVSQPQIACIGTGGFAPEPSHDGGGIKSPTVQVRIRGSAGQYQATREQAEAVFAAVDHTTFVVAGREYELAQPLQSEPLWLGYTTPDARPEWSINVRLMISRRT